MSGELHGTHVSEGRVEPLVVVPPHVPVDVRAQLFHARVRVGVYELLLDQPVGGFDHRVVVGRARPGKRTRDAEHVEHSFDAFSGELAAPVGVEHLDVAQREAQRGECGQHKFGVVSDADRMPGDLAVGEVAGQADVRPRIADHHIGRVGGQVGARLVPVELARRQVGRRAVVRFCRMRPVPGPRIRACHALGLHDPADAAARHDDAPRRGSALIFLAPYALPLSRHTRSTSPSWGSTRSTSGWSGIQ